MSNFIGDGITDKRSSRQKRAMYKLCTNNDFIFPLWVSAALFCFSPLARPVVRDTFRNYKLSSGCFAVSGNTRLHYFVKCKKDFSLASFDSTQQMDELASVLGDATYYHVSVEYKSGKTHFAHRFCAL